MIALWRVDILRDEETRVYEAQVFSLVEGKGKALRSPDFKALLAQVRKAVLKRQNHNVKSPPEAKNIISPNDFGSNLIVPARS